MSALLMYTAFGVWFVALVVSTYATYRLYEYGHYNANLAWDLFRKVTDFVVCVAFSLGAVLLVSRFNYGVDNWLLLLVFAGGFLMARVILILFLWLVSNPYVKREQERRQYTRAMMEGKIRLEKESLYPLRPKLFSENPQEENTKFRHAMDELRVQGKLPPVPKWMENGE